MAIQPIGAHRSSPNWSVSSSTCNRSYLLAGLRAGLIALALLAVLTLIVLF
ncbi:MAG TPA: hypothetical protein VFR17_03630 [Mycobacterium sp.]|nr:hypothetical protein [Mycobacterium sp.]